MNRQVKKIQVSDCGTHHCLDGTPIYNRRFDNVLPFHTPGLAPVILNGKAWHILENGSDAYTHRYDKSFGFYCDLASVCIDEDWFHIDSDGNPIYTARFAFTGNYQNDLCVVCDQNGNYFHIDRYGERVYQNNWQYCGDFREGSAVVQHTDGFSTHIDKKGHLLHDRWFDDLDVYHKGYARARDAHGWHHIDRCGKQIYENRYASVEPFYNGCARVESQNGGLFIINECGTVISQLRADRTRHFHNLSADMVGYWKTLTLLAVNRLRIIRYLPSTTDELAKTIKADPLRLNRLLRALGELGILTESETIWSLSSKGQYLTKEHPLSLASAVDEYAGDLLQRWFKLTDVIRGEDITQDIFETVAADSVRSVNHHKMLSSYAIHDYPALLGKLKFNDSDVIFDAGGGNGTLARIIAQHQPKSHVIYGDMKGVVSWESDHVESLIFDLFKPWPIKADKVILARVIHDWNDKQAISILKNAKEALKPEGEVVLFEMLLSKDSYAGALCDIHLMVATGGQERTEEDYESLLNHSGLVLSEVISGPDHVSIIRAKCVSN
jgi:2-polyprenyl-3-methyl-5-hydroxy-6-metoxy-1,4-benzoquinol methylase